MNPFAALRRTPLAWRQTSHRPMRLLAAIAGVSFANVLVFFQLGLASGLYASQKRPLQRLNGELVMVSRRYTNLGEPLNLPRSRLMQALGVQGVEAVTPLYIGKTDWLNRDSREKKQALIFGLAPENPALRIPELEADRGKLLRPDGLFFDTLSKEAAGPVARIVAKDGYYDTELRGKRAVVNGLFTMGLTFAADINLLTSASNFKTWFPDQSSDDIQLGVIQLQPGVSREQVQATLASFLDPSVRVLTLQQLEAVEVDHWRNNTSFGLIFNLGVLVGLIVGAIIVYQILYSDVSDHLPEYATMKAMGYSDRFVVGIIVQESVLLAALAFVPSLVLAIGLYAVLANSTSLLIAMTAQRAVAVFTLTLTMAAGSGWLATGKLRRLDPADIF
ncbi:MULTISPECIES: ABC transporter permease DevC [Cyanobium]|uniref:ABC transporter n=1 Tax=Cyanobium usitatum str. Tous TaxID=2116684 RepID=A0A2P7MX17_9CYAN|nr:MULTISPECIES: ABC transporter permease DevC [Cyanobium]MCP9780970.1 FtsX-like permease family protein [Cyanobium sp. To12R1]PSJ05735.1 ABC transporter [Cyanobium usitatum str. Tous]